MVKVWTVSEFIDESVKVAGTDADWLASVQALGMRAHTRGDGVAIYVNNDLGHPDLGQWQVVSYGGDEAQLETREDWGQGDLSTDPDYFVHGEDTLRRTLPDIGGRINWRYTLEAICPATEEVK